MSEENNVPNEVQERMQKFMDGYKTLVEETKMDFATYPVWVPDGQGGFRVVVQNTPVDIKNQPKKSPFIGKESHGRESTTTSNSTRD